MSFLFPLLLLIFLFIFIGFGAPLIRRVLPKDHYLQKYLTEQRIESALAWLSHNKSKLAGWLLIVVFTLITLVYS